jgi:hypothetical protein
MTEKCFELHEMREQEMRKLYNEELHNLYSSQNIVRVNGSRRTGMMGYRAGM